MKDLSRVDQLVEENKSLKEQVVMLQKAINSLYEKAINS